MLAPTPAHWQAFPGSDEQGTRKTLRRSYSGPTAGTRARGAAVAGGGNVSVDGLRCSMLVKLAPDASDLWPVVPLCHSIAATAPPPIARRANTVYPSDNRAYCQAVSVSVAPDISHCHRSPLP